MNNVDSDLAKSKFTAKLLVCFDSCFQRSSTTSLDKKNENKHAKLHGRNGNVAGYAGNVLSQVNLIILFGPSTHQLMNDAENQSNIFHDFDLSIN